MRPRSRPRLVSAEHTRWLKHASVDRSLHGGSWGVPPGRWDTNERCELSAAIYTIRGAITWSLFPPSPLREFGIHRVEHGPRTKGGRSTPVEPTQGQTDP